MRIPQPKLNVIELALWAAFVAVVAIGYTRWQLRPFLSRGTGEVQWLAERYGPGHHSEHAEEWIVRDFFSDRRDGVFVDVGANHYEHFSNTYYLETALGWSGLAVEPQGKFAADYAEHRPLTRFVPLFVSDVSDSQALLYVPSNDRVASFDKRFAEAESNSSAQSISAKTTTLDDILDRHAIDHVDFLSIDIELHEPQALKGFSIDRFRPTLVVIEAQLPVRQQILDYFATHGYVVLAKYLRADPENLWFAPLAQTANPVSLSSIDRARR